MEFSQVVKSRYSCRNFSDKRVSKETLYKIIGEALNAPSAKNTQPWEFYVTYTDESNAKIRECLQDNGKNLFLNGATAFIALFESLPDNIRCEKYGNDRFVKYDVGQMAAYLTLCAKNAGVDSCVIGWLNEEKLRKNTGVEKPCSLVIAFGYAAKTPSRAERQDYRLRKLRGKYYDSIQSKRTDYRFNAAMEGGTPSRRQTESRG